MTFFNRCVNKKCMSRSHSISVVKKAKFTISNKKRISLEQFISKMKNESKIQFFFENFDVQIFTRKRFMKFLKRSNCQTYCFYLKDQLNKKLDRFEKKLFVAASIDAVTAENHEKFMKNKIEYTLKKLNKRVLEVYHNEIEIFMKTKIDELASHRKKEHEINLKFEIEWSFIKNYRFISNQKLIAMRKYLKKHLTKDFIRFNSSKTIASILLMKKSENDFRFCVNYKNLNNITKKNRYFILLISETLTKLTKIKRFIKLNVVHAFNRMRIKEKHE